MCIDTTSWWHTFVLFYLYGNKGVSLPLWPIRQRWFHTFSPCAEPLGYGHEGMWAWFGSQGSIALNWHSRFSGIRYSGTWLYCLNQGHLKSSIWHHWACNKWVTRTIESNIDDSVQDCSNSIAKALELLQSCTKPSIYYRWFICWLSPSRGRTCVCLWFHTQLTLWGFWDAVWLVWTTLTWHNADSLSLLTRWTLGDVAVISKL